MESYEGYMPLEDDEEVNEFTVVPKKGVFLGLDISESSTGLTLCENGVRKSVNFPVILVENDNFKEVRLRRYLKSKLSEYISGKRLDLVIVEDAFQGINPSTTRLLYALNTGIDEMILDGEVECGKFFRVDNGFWKSGLFSLDKVGSFKGMSDKARIEACLSLLGVKESGRGYQDRLDSLGMLVSYFLNPEEFCMRSELKKHKKVSFSDIGYGYEEDIEFIYDYSEDPSYLKGIPKEYFPNRYLSKELILNCLTSNPKAMFITEEGVRLGNLGKSLGLPVLSSGGRFAAWVKPAKLHKYVEEDK